MLPRTYYLQLANTIRHSTIIGQESESANDTVLVDKDTLLDLLCNFFTNEDSSFDCDSFVKQSRLSKS